MLDLYPNVGTPFWQQVEEGTNSSEVPESVTDIESPLPDPPEKPEVLNVRRGTLPNPHSDEDTYELVFHVPEKNSYTCFHLQELSNGEWKTIIPDVTQNPCSLAAQPGKHNYRWQGDHPRALISSEVLEYNFMEPRVPWYRNPNITIGLSASGYTSPIIQDFQQHFLDEYDDGRPEPVKPKMASFIVVENNQTSYYDHNKNKITYYSHRT